MSSTTWLERARELAEYGAQYDADVYRLALDAAEAFDTAKMFRSIRSRTGARAIAAQEHRKGVRLYKQAMHVIERART